MSNIVIKDLTESIELDRAAMRAITGGSRASGRRILPESTLLRSNRIVDFHYPSRFQSNTRAETSTNSASKK